MAIVVMMVVVGGDPSKLGGERVDSRSGSQGCCNCHLMREPLVLAARAQSRRAHVASAARARVELVLLPP